MDQAQRGLLAGFGDKENAGAHEVPQDKYSGFFGDGGPIQIRVTANAAPPPAPGHDGGLEPLSPSKRFNASRAQLLPQPPSGLESLVSTPRRHQQPPLEGEAKQQICFDYTKGVCKRGTACKFSHDVEEIVRVNSQERGVCFDFLRACCQRGLLCRFSHDLSSIVMQDQVQKPGRRNAPICYDFVKGICKRDDCRYSHDIFSIIRGRAARPAVPQQICYDFTRGRCARGAACRYSHEPGPEALAAFPLQGDAVAALAAQHAQLAAAAALEASRRQSAPGCLQPTVPDALAAALLGGLQPQPQLPGGLPDAGAQAAFALQLQSQWLLQMQAASLAQQQQQQVPSLPGWEQQLLSASSWPAAAQMDPRRHTHDGAQRPLMDARLAQQLQELRLRQAPPEQAKLPPFDPHKGRQGSLPGQGTIGAGWHAANRLDLSRCASLDLAHQGPLLQPPRPANAGSLTDRQQPPLRPPEPLPGACQPARVPFTLRPPPPAHASGGSTQADPLWHPAAGASLRGPAGGPGPIQRASTDVAAQVAAGRPLAPEPFESRPPQRAGSEQLALFQEIWRQ